MQSDLSVNTVDNRQTLIEELLDEQWQGGLMSATFRRSVAANILEIFADVIPEDSLHPLKGQTSRSLQGEDIEDVTQAAAYNIIRAAGGLCSPVPTSETNLRMALIEGLLIHFLAPQDKGLSSYITESEVADPIEAITTNISTQNIQNLKDPHLSGEQRLLLNMLKSVNTLISREIVQQTELEGNPCVQADKKRDNESVNENDQNVEESQSSAHVERYIKKLKNEKEEDKSR
jgi:hypothetical protein